MSGLTSEERESLILAVLDPEDDCAHNMVPLFEAVDALLAARLADAGARAEAAAAKVARVEAECDWADDHGAIDEDDDAWLEVAVIRQALRGDS